MLLSVDMEFLFRDQRDISRVALTCEISSGPLEKKFLVYVHPCIILNLISSCMGQLAQVHRVKHIFDIATLEVKQSFYIQSVNICIVQPCVATRPLQKITTLLVRLLNERGRDWGAIRKRKAAQKVPEDRQIAINFVRNQKPK